LQSSYRFAGEPFVTHLSQPRYFFGRD